MTRIPTFCEGSETLAHHLALKRRQGFILNAGYNIGIARVRISMQSDLGQRALQVHFKDSFKCETRVSNIFHL